MSRLRRYLKVALPSSPAKKAKRPSPPPEGLGDVVKSMTSAVGIRPCGGCKRRAEALNRMFPRKKK